MDFWNVIAIFAILEHFEYTKKNIERIKVVPKTILDMQRALKLMEHLNEVVPEKEEEFPSTKEHFSVLGIHLFTKFVKS